MRRLPKRAARRVISEWLMGTYGMVPEFTLLEDGKAWAWFIDSEDTTSYVTPNGTVEWYGSRFDAQCGGIEDR